MKLHSREEWVGHSPKDLGATNCVFCEKQESEKEYIIWKGKHWLVIHNKFPYLGLKEHIMAIPKQHYKLSCEIPADAFMEMQKVHSFVKKFYGEKHYFSFTRETFGDRSLEHLHIHFLPGIIYATEMEALLKKQGF